MQITRIKACWLACVVFTLLFGILYGIGPAAPFLAAMFILTGLDPKP